MFSKKVVSSLSSSSWIRAMFEQGEALKKVYGKDNVYDFTLGNPDPEPSKEIIDHMIELVQTPGIHKYMANAGYMDVREKIAAYMTKGTGLEYTWNNIVMVSGAAGGLTVTMNSLLDPDDEVIAIAPFFSEYRSYVGNYGGRLVVVKSLPDTFKIDIDAMSAAINEKTKAIIINSPNNPTGCVYDEEELMALEEVLKQAESKYGNAIYVVSDEPYVKITYDGVVLPRIEKIFRNAIVVNSFSKSLALPGERIGYIAVSPRIDDWKLLIDAMIYSVRTLGFVNAPSLFQKLIADHLDHTTGLEAYKERRDLLYNILLETGYECYKPKGAFYLFPKVPGGDEAKFCDIALKNRIVLVGGTGFGYSGYFRLAYCVSRDTIINSKDSFIKARKEALG